MHTTMAEALTLAGMVAGTPEYMSPEQTNGEPIDARSDLFSLGAVLYAACTGGSPFHDASPWLTLERVRGGRPTPLHQLAPDVPGWLGQIVQRLLEKNPTEPIKRAVWGMLPKGPLGRKIFKKLKVYAGAEHPHGAQGPATLTIPQ